MGIRERAQSDNKQSAGKLLSSEERVVCKRFAAGEAPYSQRAQALLAIDEGATQVAAGQRAGLTAGQVRYWLGKFREKRLTIFPDALLVQPQPEPVPSPATAERGILAEDEAFDRPETKEAVQTESLDSTPDVRMVAEVKQTRTDSAKSPKEPKKAKETKKPKKAKGTKKSKKAKKADKTKEEKKPGKKKRQKAKGGKNSKKKAKKEKGSKKAKKTKSNKAKSGKKKKRKKS